MNVTVLTCDAYYDRVIPLFRRFFERYWPHQAYTVVSDVARDGVDWAPAPHRDNFTWSEVLIAYAQHAIETQEHSVVLMDDYLLVEPIDASKVAACAVYLETFKSVGFVRLNPCPGPTLDFDGFVGEFDRTLGERTTEPTYLVSTQPCLWRWDCLLDLLAPSESPWEFEIRGSSRAADSRWTFLGTRANLISHQNYLRGGIIVPEVQAWIDQQL